MAEGATPTAQRVLWEKEVDDAELLTALERREEIKGRRALVNQEYREADAVAKVKLRDLDLGQNSVVRAGKWLIRMSPVKARSVSFEVDATSRMKISLLPEDS